MTEQEYIKQGTRLKREIARRLRKLQRRVTLAEKVAMQADVNAARAALRYHLLNRFEIVTK